MEVSGYLRVYNRNISAKKLGPSLTGSDPQGMAENTPSIIQEKGLIYLNLTASQSVLLKKVHFAFFSQLLNRKLHLS